VFIVLLLYFIVCSAALWRNRQWKAEGVIDGESEGGDCDEVICAGWAEPGGEWTEWGWRNEEGSWLHKKGNAYL